MALWEMTESGLDAIPPTTFQAESMWERRDLQRLLRDRIEALGDGLYVLAEEFNSWDESALRIDLLCIDTAADIVVVELKRDDSGSHSELQALRYAAMVSNMTFEQAVQTHQRYLERRHNDPNAGSSTLPAPSEAEAAIRTFLQWEADEVSDFGRDVHIVLAAADFSKTLTTTAMWMRDREIDIRCIRLRPYRLPGSNRLLLDIQKVIPPPEASDYQVRVAIKMRAQRIESTTTRDFRRFWLRIGARSLNNLAKRWLAFEAVATLIVEYGVTPEAILAETAEGKRRRLFTDLAGELPPDDFEAALLASNVDARRYFRGEGQLFQINGRTYAFTNQWGLSTESFVQDLLDHFCVSRGVDAAFGPESAEDDGDVGA